VGTYVCICNNQILAYASGIPCLLKVDVKFVNLNVYVASCLMSMEKIDDLTKVYAPSSDESCSHCHCKVSLMLRFLTDWQSSG
jgi:hypothetical protein